MTSALVSVALIGGMASCTFDDTDLQNSIDDLTSRVEALENFQEQVQGDIASLQDIISKLNSSVTVNNVVDNGDGSWTINFSDGTSVTIRNGQDGEDGLTPPSITVVEEDGTYYWAYENADGTIKFILDDNGNKIPVSGEAPQVRINPDSGNWEISSDGGKTWENTGVKAEGGAGDSFFSGVYVEGGILYLVLADGTVIEVPMTAELAFDFGTDEEVLYFMAGETKELAYTMSGQESVTVNKPDGWRVSFQGSSLSVTAPAEANVYAETEGAISVILISASGQSLLAEQTVAVAEMEIVAEGETGPVHWVLASDGTMTFNGEGAMPDYTALMGADVPWADYKNEIKNVVISDGLTHIGQYAFSECGNLVSVNIPDGVESIADYAFAACGSLKEIVVPNTVALLGHSVFAQCTGLVEVVLGENITTMGNGCFDNCHSLVNISLPKALANMGTYCFRNCSALAEITVPSGMTVWGENIFEGCSGLLRITLAEGIENIGAFAFANTSGLETVVLPESIKSVGNSSFRSCALLSEVIGGSSLETVSEYAFCDCSSLENADFLSYAVSVGDFAFSATALASVSLDNAVKVGASAFLNCTALKNVVIPDCVTEMGASAFSGCSSLENLSIGSGLTSIPDSGFSGCGLKSLVVPGNIKTIGNSAFGSCESLSELTIGEGVETIGNQSFRWCSSLTELLLPDSVTDIVDMAFADTGLLAVTMGSGVKNIGFMAFSNTPDLMDVTVMAVNPPALGWFNFDQQGDVLHVPAESVEAYQADSEWGSSFTTIVAI